MKEYSVRHVVLNEERAAWRQVVFAGAHTDDDATFRLTNMLAKHRIGVTILTATNSDARNLANYTYEELPDVRWDEQLVSGNIGGVARVKRLESPDGKLRNYKGEGIAFIGEAVDEIDPLAIISLHEEDTHPDHRAIKDISNAVAGKQIPLYSTDTINGLGINGRPLTPSLYIPLTEEIEEIERQTYLANTSQVTNLPPDEMVDVYAVLDMTERRGREIGEKHAAVLFESNNTKENPLKEILLYSRAA